MSLKNRNETKLLMENWRKVLKEGLYDEDPELLEEGARELAFAAGMGMVALSGIGSALAKIPGQSVKDQNQATIGLVKKAQNIANHEDLDKEVKTQKLEEIMEIIQKIQSSENEDLNFLQKQIYEKSQDEARKQIEDMKDNYFRAKQEVENKSKSLKDLAEPEALGASRMDIENAKADLELALDNLDQAAFGLKKLFQIPGSVELRMDKNNKFLGVDGERIYSKRITRN